MLRVSIPGWKTLELEYLVLDYNGTLACEGRPLGARLREQLRRLATSLQTHVVTADTFGKVREQLADWPCRVEVLPAEDQDLGKLKYIEQLGSDHVAAVGNGRNDRLMLKRAALGIAVVQQEGAAAETMLAADIVCPTVDAALELLENPLRLVATLRS